jgi:hypothetical protein
VLQGLEKHYYVLLYTHNGRPCVSLLMAYSVEGAMFEYAMRIADGPGYVLMTDPFLFPE